MPCYYPLDGYRAKQPNDNGKYPLVFTRQEAQQDDPLRIPCGSCIGCRLEQSRQWATRCVHESTMWPDNSFITLTYDDEHLPTNQSLDIIEWQSFMKALRQQLHPKKIRFYAAGEYGKDQDPRTTRTIGRPHYHAIIFNHSFPRDEQIGKDLYRSDQLDSIWGKGFASVGAMTFESAAYVARYCTKKITGELAEQHYQVSNPETGEITNLKPEFSVMSRMPGIGRTWFDKYRKDLNKGYLTQDGNKMAIPKYYEKLLQKNHEQEYDTIKERKRAAIDPFDIEHSNNRLRAKEHYTNKRLLERSLP
ncbi:replication initiator protein [Microviridae sp.]|nr:replication initiator protein [Microviridae sp.]